MLDPRRRRRRQGAPDDRPRAPTAGTAARSSGPTTTSRTGAELETLEKLIADHGYYPYRAEPGELDARKADGSLDGLFVRAHARPAQRAGSSSPTSASDRPASGSTSCSATTTRSSFGPLLDGASWGIHDEGRIVDARRRPRDDLVGLLEHHPVAQSPRDDRGPARPPRSTGWPASSGAPERAIFNFHVPPYGSGPRRGAGPRREPGRPDLARAAKDGAGREHRRPGRDPRDPAAARSARPHPRVEPGSAGSAGRSRSTPARTTRPARSTGPSSPSSGTR